MIGSEEKTVIYAGYLFDRPRIVSSVWDKIIGCLKEAAPAWDARNSQVAGEDFRRYYDSFRSAVFRTSRQRGRKAGIHLFLPHETIGRGRSYHLYSLYNSGDGLQCNSYFIPHIAPHGLDDGAFRREVFKFPAHHSLNGRMRNDGYQTNRRLGALFDYAENDQPGRQSRLALAEEITRQFLEETGPVQESGLKAKIYDFLFEGDAELLKLSVPHFLKEFPENIEKIMTRWPDTRDVNVFNFIMDGVPGFSLEELGRKQRIEFLEAFPWLTESGTYKKAAVSTRWTWLLNNIFDGCVHRVLQTDTEHAATLMGRQARDLPEAIVEAPGRYTHYLKYIPIQNLPDSHREWRAFLSVCELDVDMKRRRLKEQGESAQEIFEAAGDEDGDFWGRVEGICADARLIPAMAERHQKEIVLPFLAGFAQEKNWKGLSVPTDFLILSGMPIGMKALPHVKNALSANGGYPLIKTLYSPFSLPELAERARWFHEESASSAPAPDAGREILPVLLSRGVAINWKALPEQPRQQTMGSNILLKPVASLGEMFRVAQDLESYELLARAQKAIGGKTHYMAGYTRSGVVGVAALVETQRPTDKRIRLHFNRESGVHGPRMAGLLPTTFCNSDEQGALARMADAVDLYVDWLNTAPVVNAQGTVTASNRLKNTPDLTSQDVDPRLYAEGRQQLLNIARKGAGLKFICGGNPYDPGFNDMMIRMHGPYLPENATEAYGFNGAISPAFMVAAAAKMAAAAMKIPLSQLSFRVIDGGRAPGQV